MAERQRAKEDGFEEELSPREGGDGIPNRNLEGRSPQVRVHVCCSRSERRRG